MFLKWCISLKLLLEQTLCTLSSSLKKKASRTAVLNRLHVSPAQNLAIQIYITPFPSEVSFVFVCIYEWVSWGYIS